MFVDMLSAAAPRSARRSTRAATRGRSWGRIAPAHYLKQFLPKYAGQDKVDAAGRRRPASTAGSTCFKFKDNWRSTPSCRCCGPGGRPRRSTPRSGRWSGTRTSGASTPTGNQLPYIDKIQLTLGREPRSGEPARHRRRVRRAGRHMDVAKLPVFLENQQKGNYTVAPGPGRQRRRRRDPDQPELRGRSRDRASGCATSTSATRSSLGIDRDQINEAFWLGIGTPGSPVPDETSPDNPGPEWRNKWSTLDVKQANELLDKIGLTKKDSEGYRLRTDKARAAAPRACRPSAARSCRSPQISEMIAQQWKKIGIHLDVEGARAQPGREAARRQRAPDRCSGRTTARSCCTATRTTPCPIDAPDAAWAPEIGEVVRLERRRRA